MKKILFVLLASIMFGKASYAQNTTDTDPKYSVYTGSFWSNWYAQAGLDMTLQNPYGKNFSEVFPKGKTFGLNIAVGKWFTPETSVRIGLNWQNGIGLLENGHLQWVGPVGMSHTNVDKGGFATIYGEVLFNLHNIFLGYDADRIWNVSVFPRAGISRNFACNTASPLVGVGVETTYSVNERLKIYGEAAYQVTTSEFMGGVSGTGMTVSTGCNGFFDIAVGVRFDLGKSKGKFVKPM